MPYTAVIVESPAKCSKIEKFLGPGYKCMASFGHLRTIDHLNCIDVGNNFNPTFNNITSKSRQISTLRSFIGEAQDVLLAADDDREGEAIAWHICQLYNLPVATTKRIIFHEITENALKAAVQSPTRINMELVQAQQARQILDLIVGFKLSPMLWSNISFKTEKGLSAGRCQTPALRLVYENQKDIDASPGRKVYNTTGYFTSMNLDFSLDFNHDGEKPMEEFLCDSVPFEHVYECGNVRKTTKNPPSPFTTSALQQSASTELRLSPKATMDACQKLYEGGYITYMRTDSKTYSIDFIKTAKVSIKKRYGDEYIHPEVEKLAERGDDKKQSKKKKSKKKEEESNAQEAHEAIRPTKIDVTCVSEEGAIGSREAKVYALIWRNTMESCMAAAIYNGVTAKISAPEDHNYKYSTEQVVFPGWKVVAGYEETNPVFTFLQQLKPGVINYKRITSKVTMKDLKSHFTEAKLVQLLEQHGIGRPSTFASLIDKIQERGYVKKANVTGKKVKCIDFDLVEDVLEEKADEREFGGEKGKLVIQQLGVVVMDFLLQHYDDMFTYDYTKSMEDTLDLIAKGDSVWHDLCRSCLEQIDTLSGGLKTGNKEQIQIDANHTYMIAKYGPVIKCVNGSKTTFKKVREDIDLDKLRRGEYELSDIIVTRAASNSGRMLGKHVGKDVELKKGRFGLYAIWGGANINIKLDVKDYETIELKDVTAFLVKPVLLEISKAASIRNGKHGPYIYYKTDKMKKPKFLALDKDIKPTCTIAEAKAWLNEKHDISL